MDAYSIPQPVYDHYNAHYSNATYRDFGNKFKAKFGWADTDQVYVDTMNLLTDAALEASGAQGSFVGAYNRLVQGMSDELVFAINAHLNNFLPAPHTMLPRHQAEVESERKIVQSWSTVELEHCMDHAKLMLDVYELHKSCGFGDRSLFEKYQALVTIYQQEQVRRATVQLQQADSLLMNSGRRVVIGAILPYLTVQDILNAIANLTDRQLSEMIDGLPDEVTDLILELADPVDLFVPEAGDLYPEAPIGLSDEELRGWQEMYQ